MDRREKRGENRREERVEKEKTETGKRGRETSGEIRLQKREESGE